MSTRQYFRISGNISIFPPKNFIQLKKSVKLMTFMFHSFEVGIFTIDFNQSQCVTYVTKQKTLDR